MRKCGRTLALFLFWIACWAHAGAQMQDAARSHVGDNAAQTADAGRWPNGSVELNSGWRVQSGDDPAYALPGYDDSSWQKITLRNATRRGEFTDPGNARWYRIHVHLVPATAYELLLTGSIGSFELYADGVRLGPRIRSSFLWMNPSNIVYTLPSHAGDGSKDLVLAVRSHYYYREFGSKGDLTGAVLGTPIVIDAMAAAQSAGWLNSNVFGIFVYLLTVATGLLFIALYLQQRGNQEYLWLGLTLICNGLSNGMIEAVYGGLVPASVNAIFGDPPTYWWIAAELEFAFAFTGKRPGRLVRFYQAILIATPILLDPLYWMAWLPASIFDPLEIALSLPGFLLIAVLLILWWARGSKEAKILVAPLLISNVILIAFDGQDFSDLVHLGLQLGFTLHVGGIAIYCWDLAELVFLVAIGAVMFLRFTRASREQARTAAELEAARAVQQVLLPELGLGLEGFAIETQYLPAQEVGGDFFQLVPTAEGGLLIVTGDVSGKGMPAAMLVALLVGAIRTEAAHTSDPAGLLATLNLRVYGRMSSGFATCAALYLSPDGTAVIANAANPAPYLNGKELGLPGALPLGMTAAVDYENHALKLETGDVLTFVSDGVVEAADATGELFGFERTAAISTQSAEAIARAAQSFGQEDDITVLTIRRAGFAEAAHA